MKSLIIVRKELGLSQDRLADLCGLNQWSISAIERGRIAPRPETRNTIETLKVGEKWEKKNDPALGEYYDIYPTTPWNYGIVRAVVDDPGKNATVIEKSITGNFYWNQANAPFEIKVQAR